MYCRSVQALREYDNSLDTNQFALLDVVHHFVSIDNEQILLLVPDYFHTCVFPLPQLLHFDVVTQSYTTHEYIVHMPVRTLKHFAYDPTNLSLHKNALSKCMN
uniref:Uncharacterized protein n=1 Tax=Timspurckia oligopyrenoides TaxID=708627 RepID=A0A7S1EPH4_9RHOD